MKLSPTQMQILTAAAKAPDRVATAPEGLPAAARNAVFRSMLKAGLLVGEDGAWTTLRITPAGLLATGIEPAPEASTAETAMTEADIEEELRLQQALLDAEAAIVDAAPVPRLPLRDAAQIATSVWAGLKADAEGTGSLDAAMALLAAALEDAPRGKQRAPKASRQPRQGTKQEAVLAMLRRPEGATIAQVMEVTGWAQHTVRGFFAGLKKRHGIEVKVLERVRQVGPNKQGAKGSYSIYHVAEGG